MSKVLIFILKRCQYFVKIAISSMIFNISHLKLYPYPREAKILETFCQLATQHFKGSAQFRWSPYWSQWSEIYLHKYFDRGVFPLRTFSLCFRYRFEFWYWRNSYTLIIFFSNKFNHVYTVALWIIFISYHIDWSQSICKHRMDIWCGFTPYVPVASYGLLYLVKIAWNNGFYG